MNKVILMGRFTKDPEVNYAKDGSGNGVATFTLAVDRRYVKKDDPNAQTADFIRCKGFGKTAQFVEQYFHKGMKAVVEGNIQTGKYTNRDGQTVFTTDVVVENIEFAESKNASNGGNGGNGGNSTGGFQGGYVNGNSYDSNPAINIPEGVNEVLPFS